MGFRMWGLLICKPWHLVAPMACVGAIDRDYVNVAPGLRAVTGIQRA